VTNQSAVEGRLLLQIPRRSLMSAAAALAGSIAAPVVLPTELPVTNEFVVDRYEVCLNNARWHPMSRGAKQAIVDYLDYKMRGVWVPSPGLESPEAIAVRKAFAALIGATPTEVAFVNSTTAGENMIVAALGLHRPGKNNIVTDALHFEAARLAAKWLHDRDERF
jgi:selenocysteine lyase/cysteine desulfurase